MEKYMDITLSHEERAKDLIDKLSLDEKIAQITGVFAVRGQNEKTNEYIKNGIGQVSTLFFRDEATREACAKWQIELQKQIMANSPHHIPAVFHMEGLCGAYINGATAFPSGINRGASFDPDMEERIGSIVSRQEAAVGITQVLAPVLDISRDSRMGRQSEPYGEDPTLAARMGVSFTRGIQEKETAGRRSESVAKHFLGFHNSQGGIHGANVDAGDRLLYEIYAKPFQASIAKADLKGVMPCYCSIGGLPIHASKHYLTELLRNEMGFRGVVASDYSALTNVFEVANVCESKAEAGIKCLNAGMDLELPNPDCYSEDMKNLFETGEADIAILDRAVYRVLLAKFRMGIFEHPYALEGDELENAFSDELDDEVARISAQESIILLKNSGVLPLQAKKLKIAVIGPHAANPRYYFGGYTHLSMVEASRAAMNSMAGIGEGGDVSRADMKRIPGTGVQDDEAMEFNEILNLLEPDCKSILEVLGEELPEAEIRYSQGYYKAGSDEGLFDDALKIIEEADVAILTIGGKNGSGSIATMGEGVDGTDIGLPKGQENFILKARALGRPMIGIHFDGRPVSSDIADENLDAIIEAFTPGTFAAEAVVNVITGAYNPSGRLPVTVARNAGQIPIYYDHPNGSAWHQGPSIGFKDYVDMPHTPRYEFGFGLSYTKFEYTNLKTSKCEVNPLEYIEISLDITNTGDKEGTEVVQLYLSDVKASMTRPVRELQGFRRVSLKPGEMKTLKFVINPNQMAFLDEDMKWKVEKGEFLIQVGASSEDIRLRGSYYVKNNAYIVGKDREFYAYSEEIS